MKLTEPPSPNAYGYRTIWNALMTADTITSVTGAIGYDKVIAEGHLTNDLIVTGRDETVTIGTVDQPQYPWIGYQIEAVYDHGSGMTLDFDINNYPTADEANGWTLTLGGGVELPFAGASHISNHSWAFNPVFPIWLKQVMR